MLIWRRTLKRNSPRNKWIRYMSVDYSCSDQQLPHQHPRDNWQRRVKVRECKLLNPQLFPASTWRGGSSSFLEPGLALDWPSLGVKQPRAVTVIPSITWPLLTTGNQQPSLQSRIEGWQWRKVAAAMLPTPALHSHSCTSCGAALSAGFMHTQCYDFLKDVFLLNGLNWESADL